MAGKDSINQAKPLISILTPTWNRASYLDRVWNGLNSQTYRNIEWVVCNDGSTDGTDSKLKELSAKSQFPVTIISASVRIGKARMDNEAVLHAKGEYILWNDSDDYLLPHAIEKLVETLNTIPEPEREDYVGITALCANEDGVMISTKLPSDQLFDTSWNDLVTKFKVKGDMIYLTRSSVLKNHPFPEIDFMVPESIVWNAIGNAKARICPVVVEIKQYNTSNCISFSGKMEYSRGRVYAMASIEKYLNRYPKHITNKLWTLITFIRLSIHGELNYAESIKLWGSNSPLIVFILMTPIAVILSIKDRLQKKVRKTHREFDIAKKSVVVNITTNGQSYNHSDFMSREQC